MSFFGRAANLIKGGIKSIGRPPDTERERALDAELAREAERGRARPAGSAPSTPKGAPESDRTGGRPPERDEHGNVKRTL